MSSQDETVARLEREIGDALARRDVASLRRLFADDFVGINPIGLEVTKGDMIEQIGSTDYEPESIVNDVGRVRVFDNVAFVLARGTAKGTYKGQRADMTFTYMRIWVKRDDVWQAVAAHAAPAATPGPGR